MNQDFSHLPPLKVPAPPKRTSLASVLGIFVAAFVAILLILNLPALISGVAYPFTHSTESNNEQLTQQYRDLYGYDKHPELITAVEASTVTSALPVAGENSRTSVPANFQGVISIPKINVSAPVIAVGDTSDATILGALKKGVVLYPGSALPGQSGTTVIVGHSSSTLPWTAYSAIFSLLGKLQTDDLIYITVGSTQHTYRIQTVQKGSAQQLISSGLTGDLILSTCWPVGTATNRIEVSATLIRQVGLTR
jgi:LPXTG-site transpeptidase (sortase) family protein